MKFGLGESYDNVDVLPRKIRAYIDITKPASTLGVAGGYLLASLFYFYYIGAGGSIADEFSTIIFAVVTMGFAHGAAQAMNMAEDAEMDRQTEHKQNRPIPSGVIDEDEARAIAWILIFAAVARAFITNTKFGLFVTVLCFFGVFYNLSPIRAKERIISIPWQAASRGLFMFPTVWAAYGNPWQPTPWILGVFMFWYVLGFQNSADIIDRHVDAEHGIRTFIVEFGVRRTGVIACGCTAMMFATLIAAIEFGMLPEHLYSMVLLLPMCLVMLAYMFLRPERVSETTGNHPAWLWFYIGMVASVAVPLVSTIAV